MTTLTAPFDTMTLAEHVAFCRGLRVQYEEMWGKSDAQNLSDTPGSADPVLPHRPAARRSRSAAADLIPTRPDFWRELRDFNEAHEKPVEEQGKHSHYRRSVNWLAHPGNCPDGSCLRRKVKWLCSFPEEDHRGRNGRRLAERYGVEVR